MPKKNSELKIKAIVDFDEEGHGVIKTQNIGKIKDETSVEDLKEIGKAVKNIYEDFSVQKLDTLTLTSSRDLD